MNKEEIKYKYSQRVLRLYKDNIEVSFFRYYSNNKDIIVCCSNELELNIVKYCFNNFNSNKVKNNKYVYNNRKYKLVIINKDEDIDKLKGSLSDFLISFNINLRFRNKILLNMDLKEKEIIEHINFNKEVFKYSIL